MEVLLVHDTKALLGEGPCYDDRTGRLYWVDILEHRLHAYSVLEQRHEQHEFHHEVSAVSLTHNEKLLLAMKDGFHYMDPMTGTLEFVAKVEAGLPDNRMNDGKCDPYGRMWAGTMNMEGDPEAGSLYRLERDGSVHQVLSHVGCSNGLAWDEARSRMYFIDSLTRQVDGFDYDVRTGSISGRRTVIQFSEGDGLPDGMTIDAEGMLWVAHWGGSRVSRCNPDTGKQVAEVQLPVPYVTSCTFGGNDWGELYITTARTGLSEEELDRYPLAGGLFKAIPGVKGTRSYRYRT